MGDPATSPSPKVTEKAAPPSSGTGAPADAAAPSAGSAAAVLSQPRAGTRAVPDPTADPPGAAEISAKVAAAWEEATRLAETER